MKNFTPSQLKEFLDLPENSPMLLDVREAWEFNICHILNSQPIPMKTIPNKCNDWDKNSIIVIICHNGIRSKMVAQYLDRQGFTSIINLSTGIDGWAKEIEPDMPTYR